MERINLQKLIEEKGLDFKELSELLFPDNSHPLRALERHIKLNLELTESQILRLASLTGLSVCQLFSGEEWERAFIEEEDKWVFKNKSIRAEFYPTTGLVRFYDSSTKFYEAIITEKKNILMSEFIGFLKETVNNYKNQNA